MPSPIRPAVLASPDYPFVPVDARVKLDQNESAQDFPPALKALVCERLQAVPWNRYPDLNSESLRDAIAAHEGWPSAGVVVTTGSNVLIGLLTQLAGIGQRVVTAKPNFALYALGAKLLEARLTEVPLRADLSLDLDGLRQALRPLATDAALDDTRGVLYLPQPHAPTGSVVAFEDLRSLARAASDWLVVIDEAYHPFSRTDCKPIASELDHVVLLRTFSKAWGLAGLRLGYALTSPEVAKNLRKLVPPFACSTLQVVAAQVALAHPGYVTERVRQVIEERERLQKALASHPRWTVHPSQANFILVRTPDAGAAFQHLLRQGVLVRRQDGLFGLEGCLRVSIGTPAENDAFLAAALSA